MKDRLILLIAAFLVVSAGSYLIGQDSVSHYECGQSIASEKLETNKYKKEVEQLKEEIEKLQQQIAYTDETETQAAVIYDSLPLSSELQQYTYEQCVAASCDSYYELVLAIMWQESHFDAAAVSATNDYGLMQINRVNHKWLSTELGVTDFLDAKQNIRAGVYLLSKLVDKYKDPHAVLMAYNLGEGGAKKKWQQGVYSTDYSLSVMRKKDMVKENSYI